MKSHTYCSMLAVFGLISAGCASEDPAQPWSPAPMTDGGAQVDQVAQPDGKPVAVDGAGGNDSASAKDGVADSGAGDGEGGISVDGAGGAAGDGWKSGEWGPCMSSCGAGSWNHYRPVWCVKAGVEYKGDDAIAQCGKAGKPEEELCDDSACSAAQKHPCSGAITQLTEESLDGSTTGFIDGAGAFANGGWRCDGGRIIYDLGALRKHGFFEATIYDTLIPFTAPAVDWIEVQLLSGYEKPPYKWYVGAPNWPSHFAWRFGDTSGLGGIWKVAGHAIDRDLPDYKHWQGWFDTWSKTPQSTAAVTYRFEWNVTELTVKRNGDTIKTFVFNSHEFMIQKLLVGPDDFFPKYTAGAWPVYFKNVKFGYDPSCQ